MCRPSSPPIGIDRPACAGTVSRGVGYAWMSVAVSVWASWLVLTSSGVTTDLSPVDLAGFRALVPAVVLAPFLWRQRRQVARIGLWRSLLLSAYGAPFTLCVGYGLGFAPVAHAGAMVPGLMPVMVTVIGVLIMGQGLSAGQSISALLIATGVAAIVLGSTEALNQQEAWTGHALFLLGALFWACFTVTVRRHAIAPFLAAAIVAVVSMVGLAPVWAFAGLSTLATASAPDIAFQLIFQGVITGLVSLYAFGQALRVLGSVATRLTALTPVVATCLAVPVLSQVPDLFDVAALGAVLAGLLIASAPSRVGLKTGLRSSSNR